MAPLMRVALLTPTDEHRTQFYGVFSDFMRIAAHQLDVELEIVAGTHHRGVMIERGLELASRTTRPDYVVLTNYLGVAPELLPAFCKAGIRSLLVVEGLSPAERVIVGHDCRSTVLGEIIPDDVEMGRKLAEVLATEARHRHLMTKEGKVPVGVVAGVQSAVASQRFRGWQAFRDGTTDVVQTGFRYGGFDEEEARSSAGLLLASAPVTTVLWCFNDTMALGAVTAAKSMGLSPGEKLLIGGIDLLDGGLAAIVEGSMHASIGGHLVDGARALLLLYDHHELGDLRGETHKTPVEVVTAREAERFRRLLRDHAWRDADFTRFSARRNPSSRPPELTLRALVDPE